MEIWSWGDVAFYFIFVFFSFFKYLSIDHLCKILVIFPVFVLFQLPYNVLKEFTVVSFKRRNPDRPYSTFFEFSALQYMRWVLRTFPSEIIRNVFFGELHARALFAMRRFKYGPDNVGDFNYMPVKTDSVTGFWVRSESRCERKPDLVIYFVPGNMAGGASAYFYVEYLAMLMVELQIQGFRNPSVFCIDLNYSDFYKSGYVSLIEAVSQGWQYVLDEYPRARNCFMASGSGGTILLSLLLYMAKPEVGIGGLGLQRSDEESLKSVQEDKEKLFTANDSDSILSPLDDLVPNSDSTPINKSLSGAPDDLVYAPTDDVSVPKITDDQMIQKENDMPISAAAINESLVNFAKVSSEVLGNVTVEKSNKTNEYGNDDNEDISNLLMEELQINSDLVFDYNSEHEAETISFSECTRKIKRGLSECRVNENPEVKQQHTVLRRPDSVLLISPLSRIVMTRKDQYPDFMTPPALNHLSSRLVKPEEEACLWTMPSYVRDKQWWSDAMPKKGIVIMYGGKETMKREIEHTIATLREANKSRVVSVCSDDNIHSWPIVSAYLGRTSADQMEGITQIANHIAKMLVMDCLYSKHLANC